MEKLKYYIPFILILLSSFYVNINLVNSLFHFDNGDGLYKWEIVNFDGDLSLLPEEDAHYWNHHSFRFNEDVQWDVSFSEEVKIQLATSWGDSGHIATGMWWSRGFKRERKIPINNIQVRVEFDVIVNRFYYEEPDEWLRVALACAVQRSDNNVIYTELDILDSPNTQKHITGNIMLGGDVIYKGGDVVEYKIDEIPLKTWRHYTLEITKYIDNAWKIREGDMLESIYIVIETDNNPVEVELRIDNLWISISPVQVT